MFEETVFIIFFTWINNLRNFKIICIPPFKYSTHRQHPFKWMNRINMETDVRISLNNFNYICNTFHKLELLSVFENNV